MAPTSIHDSYVFSEPGWPRGRPQIHFVDHTLQAAQKRGIERRQTPPKSQGLKSTLVCLSKRLTQQDLLFTLSLFLPQAAKVEKPEKHRIRKSEREEPGPLIPNSPGYTPVNRGTPKKAEKLSMQELIAQELAEMQGGE